MVHWTLIPRAPGPGAAWTVACVAGAGTLALALAAGGADGVGVLRVLSALRDALDPSRGLGHTLAHGTPLALAALGAGLARRAGLWNVGAEGQVQLGAWLGIAVALGGAAVPSRLAVATLLGGSALGGALIAAAPVLLRTRRGVSEVYSGLLLNLLALGWLALWVGGPWAGQTLDARWRLTTVGPGLHLGALAPWIGAAVLTWFLRRGLFGYELRVIRSSPAAARYAGLPVEGRQLVAASLAGALTGLAGGVAICGQPDPLLPSPAVPGAGYLAILAAALAGDQALGAVLVAFGLAALQTAWGDIAPTRGPDAALLLAGVLGLCVLIGQAVTRLRVVRGLPGAAPRPTDEL